MNMALLKALMALIPAGLLFLGSILLFVKQKTLPTLLQLVGGASLMTVVVTHVCEALNLFPRMHWGRADSVGHYLDLWSAVLAVTLFSIGYFLGSLRKPQDS